METPSTPQPVSPSPISPTPSSSSAWLTMPVAVVIAAVIIGGAILFSTYQKDAAVKNDQARAGQQAAAVPTDIVLPAVSAADHIIGSPDAKIVMVEYSDLECPYCKRFQVTGHQLMDKYGKDNSLAWVYRHFPLIELHSKAPKEAEASECVAAQGGNDMFWKYIDAIYTTTTSNNTLDASQLPAIAKKVGADLGKFNDCLTSGTYSKQVLAGRAEAAKAGGQGTPFSVFILKTPVTDAQKAEIDSINSQIGDTLFTVSKDGTKISMSGAIPFDLVSSFIDMLLKK